MKYISETQYTGHSFDKATLVVSFVELKISCSIRTVLEATINSGAFITINASCLTGGLLIDNRCWSFFFITL